MVKLVKGDMRAFELPERFRLATMPFRPFQNLTTVEDQLACLGCIHRHLEEGADHPGYVQSDAGIAWCRQFWRGDGGGAGVHHAGWTEGHPEA